MAELEEGWSLRRRGYLNLAVCFLFSSAKRKLFNVLLCLNLINEIKKRFFKKNLYNNPAAQQKLTQYCKSTMLQKKKNLQMTSYSAVVG